MIPKIPQGFRRGGEENLSDLGPVTRVTTLSFTGLEDHHAYQFV